MLSRQANVKVDQLPYKWSPYSIDFINKVYYILCSCFFAILSKDWALMAFKRSKTIHGFLMSNGKRYWVENINLPSNLWYELFNDRVSNRTMITTKNKSAKILSTKMKRRLMCCWEKARFRNCLKDTILRREPPFRHLKRHRSRPIILKIM